MEDRVLNPKEYAFRENLLAAISKAVQSGMQTGEIVVTILELARISCEGSLMSLEPDKRLGAKKCFVEVLDEMSKHLMGFEPPSVEDIERLARLGQTVLKAREASDWDENDENVH